MNQLRKNQLDAIKISIDNNFESGIHFHATGAGKSWIGMNILLSFNNKYPNKNVLWLCERKDILIEQFDKDNLQKRNFLDIMDKFNVFNYSKIKISDWYDNINFCNSDDKPILLIINRAFLTSNNKYKKLLVVFDLIIHDECHTIVNNSTQHFYNYMLECNSELKCIGFSATPFLEIYPFNKILSSYSIYDAFTDKIIVPPKIIWLSYKDILSSDNLAITIKNIIDSSTLYYKKIIIWCGMIEKCNELALLWKKYFNDYLICIDTSVENTIFADFSEFKNVDSKAILFCACKHREGSDIKNLDCCIFLDKVANRCPKVFVQSIGRVLRLDKENNKKYGLIIDVRAKSSSTICSSLNKYISIEDRTYFPWHYHDKKIIINGKEIKINILDIQNKLDISVYKPIIDNYSDIIHKFKFNNTTKDDVKKLFIRDVPNKIYEDRINYELDMIYDKKLIGHILQALEILKLTNNIPHVTRGSCGSSLVCYLLGISHTDPVKHNIKFSRFLNKNRSNLPDIDLDFPHYIRDQVFFKLQLKWPGKIARISNHVYYHDRSALRQAIRNSGIRKFIGKYEINNEVSKFPEDTQLLIKSETEKLKDTFSHYSLHCGGIVYYPKGVPKDLLLNANKPKILHQISLNKVDIAKNLNFKIDILSSRALSQLYQIVNNNSSNINFENFKYDQKTVDMLARGENIGLTLAESPLIRMAFMKFKPKCIYDIAVCLSIIRPAAKDANKLCTSESLDSSKLIIFDDDAIEIISKEFNISEDEADKYRRGFSKNDKKIIEEFRDLLSNYTKEEQKNIFDKLHNLSKYGFCKSHALSYAQLVWKLAYYKANKPKEFWKATLNNCHSSYRNWVHLYEAKLAGVEKLSIKKDISIYAENRRKKIENLTVDQQLRNYGYWTMNNSDFYPECYYYEDNGIYHFNGIIAIYRLKKNILSEDKHNKMAMIFIGVAPRKYIQINIIKIKFFNSKNIGIKGSGKIISEIDKLCDIITADDYQFY